MSPLAGRRPGLCLRFKPSVGMSPLAGIETGSACVYTDDDVDHAWLAPVYIKASISIVATALALA